MQTQPNHTQDTPQTFISFVIPAYNVPADMLHDCIESIRRLSLRKKEREIILVDDGSDSNLLQAVGNLADEIIYIRQKNSGVSSARNLGLRIAHGEYVQFIDGDDMLLRAPYEHVMDLMRYGHADMVIFNFTDSSNDKVTTNYEDKGPMTGTELLNSRNIHGSVCGFLFKRSILGSLHFTPNVAYGEDEEFTPQLLLRAEQVYHTTAMAYYYRMRPASAINSRELRSRLKRLNDAKTVIYNLEAKASVMPIAERKAMRRRVAQLTMDYIYNVITLTQNRHYLNRRLEELGRKGLYPLPDQNYTKKYKWFRRMTNSSMGLTILMRTLPMLNKER